MTPIGPSEEYIRIPEFDNYLSPWMTTDCNYQLDLSPEGMYNSSYDPFALPGSTGAPSSYLTPETLDVGWARSGSVSTTKTSNDSPVTEFSYLEADADANPVPDLVPSSSEPAPAVQYDNKRGMDSSERPSKRNCSQAIGTDWGFPTAAPATKSKESRSLAPCKSTKIKVEGKSKIGKKSRDKHRPSLSSTSSSQSGNSSHKVQLRTASRKPKQNGKDSGSSPAAEDKDEDDLLTPNERRARHSHNLVEKQYRNRLNQQFESLLAVLPADGNRSFSGSGGPKTKPRDVKGSVAGVEGDDRRLSKAEVLDMARQRIVKLESECNRLQSERMELAANRGFARVANPGIAGAPLAA
ncbi:hypothetical protein CONLIGDRAFT_629958 [Coniochaeta ligniaria NRRL 30616]|uniref:BHLH domain-containing protein n=1 Tax=Coniochaeta ligniaria NRRL 30616 TaxID=1408157 RepID=A0A1J7JSD1_9PEZI|nr:hypothetical protein CONLIGDRAFT_629958 [Coniochaeta ligniaria NRRL 30616]